MQRAAVETGLRKFNHAERRRMFCSLCGCEVAEGDRFCKFCGGALVAENASVDASASSVTNDVGRGSKDGPTSPWRAWKNFFRKYFDGSGRAS